MRRAAERAEAMTARPLRVVTGYYLKYIYVYIYKNFTAYTSCIVTVPYIAISKLQDKYNNIFTRISLPVSQ